MGIKFHCSECEHKIHVKAFLAGKRAICPHCGAKVRIPQGEDQAVSVSSDEQQEPAAAAEPEVAGQSAGVVSRPVVVAQPASVASVSAAVPTSVAVAVAPALTATAQPTVSDPIAEAPSAVWYVRPKGGGQYGPAPAATMRQWIDEGRVSIDSLVWREGWDEWQSASVLIAPAAPAGPVGSVSAGPVPADPVAAPSVMADAPAYHPIARRRSNGLTLAMIVVLGIMAVSLVGILIGMLSR